MVDAETLTARVLETGKRAGLAAVGVADAGVQQPARAVLGRRKASGLASTMQFTYRNPERSTDPRRHLPSARSLVVGALAYGTDGAPERAESGLGPRGRVARYARNNSYRELGRALDDIAGELRAVGYRAVVVADSNHLVDRNAAWRAGLGWYGKNSNLLLPDVGSWVVLGSVLTDAELIDTGPPMTDGCGRCQACVTDCPTGAIVAPGVVDAGRCIAWLVQAAEPIPRRFRDAVGDRMYGCDECQDVCPVGRRDAATPVELRPSPPGDGVHRSEATGRSEAAVDVVGALNASDSELLSRYGHWYIANRDPDVIRRTALVVLGNEASPADADVVEPVLRRYLGSSKVLLVCHAIWAAAKLDMSHLIPNELWQSEDEQIQRELAAVSIDARPAPRLDLRPDPATGIRPQLQRR